ncbi:MAG: radical SAM protein, partial [Phycisphaerae bacterium]
MVAAANKVLDPALEPIREKVLAGERLTPGDGLALYRTRDIFTLGQLANIVRERKHGRRAFYNINRHINYTNYCVLRCKFCSFYRPYSKKGVAGEDGYELSIEQVVELAAEAADRGATEVHIVGGLHPKLPFSYYTEMCRAIKQRCPGLHIKAFTAIEIVHFTRIVRPRMSIQEVLIALRDAGLDSLPGGGAEIFDDRVHEEAFQAKVGEKHWFDVHRTAHDLGTPSNATMLYGHVESVEQRLNHLIKLREHQDVSLANVAAGASPTGQSEPGAPATGRNVASGPRAGRSREGRHEATKPRSHGGEGQRDRGTKGSGGNQSAIRNPQSSIVNRQSAIAKAAFNCCVPLPFIPEGSEFAHLPGPTGLDDLRTLAVSRLMLDNFPHIKAFWIMQSPKLAQVALNWGVDDFDGTVVWYDITKREGRGTNRQELTVEQIKRLIREAGCIPVERDSLYR